LTYNDNFLVSRYFSQTANVNLTNNGGYVFFNARTGDVLVHSTPENLSIVEQVFQLLNKVPPQVQIDSKFAAVTQTDTKGVGFDWYLGNMTLNNGAIGAQAGSAPSYQATPTTANPSGIFPGANSANAISPSASDGVLTSGLGKVASGAPSSAAGLTPLATITGILTDPQFRMVISAIQNRDGADVLSAPRVTTESGRQAHVQVTDLVNLITGVFPTGGTTAVGTGLGTTSLLEGHNGFTFNTSPFSEGPTLDVLPTISADGYSIQMVLIPTLTEFVGYDSPGQFIPTTQAATASAIGVPISTVQPLPHTRVRQIITSVNVWDGQTVMLGGLISENIAKMKDQIPVLGDLPILGRFFRNEYSYSSKQNLMVFVTATIIDPAGNRVHSDDDLPFAKATIPPQPTAPQNH